jgi:TonB family protein
VSDAVRGGTARRHAIVIAVLALCASACAHPSAPPPASVAGDPDAGIEYPRVVVENYPKFGECALGERNEVAVTMRVSVDETGVVRDVVVIDSTGRDFDARAKKAMFGFRFAPARAHGVPIRMAIPYRFVFRKRDGQI